MPPVCVVLFFMLLVSWLHIYAEKRLLLQYARCYSQFLWLCLHVCSFFMVDYAKKRQLCTRLCSFLLFVCLPFILYAFFCLYRSVSAPYSLFRSRSLVSQHSFLFCLTFHTLQRCSTSHWKPSRRQTFFAPCAKAYGYTLSENEKQIKVLFVELTSETNEKKGAYCVPVILLTVPGTLYVPILDDKN